MIKSQDEFIITQDTHEERGNDLKNISTEMIQTETGRGKKKWQKLASKNCGTISDGQM